MEEAFGASRRLTNGAKGILRLLDREGGGPLPYTLPTDRSVLIPQGADSLPPREDF